MYPESFIKEVEEAAVLSEVIGRKVPLKRRGRDYVACCPFHHEKTPSFSVSDMKGVYHCFGCGKGGNVFTFVMETEGLNFKEAVEYLANMYGIAIPKVEKKTNIKKEEIDEIEEIYKINEETCKFFQKNLFEFYGKQAWGYALKRGFNKENAVKFRIGFAADDFKMLLSYLKSLNFKEEIIEKAGVIAKGNSGYYDKFRNRLMFPVLDKKGRVIAFTGRILDDGMPKYMNSPETKIYHKGRVLFNYYFAKKAIYDSNSAVLVEGNMDAISLYMNGIENVVAPMGTGITVEQMRELWSTTDNIFVCLDGDSAGQKASVRLAKLILPIIAVGKNMKFVFLPKDCDPDDFVKKYGKLKFNELLKASVSLSDYLWDNELKELEIDEKETIVPEKKAKLEKNIAKYISLIGDTKLRKYFEDFYKNKLWNLGKSFLNIDKNKSKKLLKSYENQEKTIDLMEKNEKKICSLLVKYPSAINLLFEKYSIDIFDVEFIAEKSNAIMEILDFYLNSNVEEEKNLNEILVKNDLNTYISECDIFFNNSYLNLSQEKAVEMLNILLLEREVMGLEFDLKEASKNGDIVRTKKLGDEILHLKNRMSLFLSKSSFI